ncbi:MAG: hypothetical protein DWQ34_25995 [Planctomycetota bacterium]|nr:MAG: hypothetical protein DWQ34_25995 [Planctomycetota bacterium]REK21663.1 MAG: hypothetical protein DWQ41_20545 [Planctomycetota bacterium]REK32776.1 MAG: hypothetical protein DWQ45_16905 [Planctomycetota bacterium]
MAKHRSPIHPNLTVEDAVKSVEVIYKHERRNPVPVEVIAKHCGYDSFKSSSAKRLISTLLQYGLVDDEGSGDDRKMKLSQLALDIVLADGSDDPNRKAAVRRSARLPAVHAKILSEFPDRLPSPATLKSYLIRDLDFNDSQVDTFINKFRKTVDFADLYGENDDEEGEGANGNGHDDESLALRKPSITLNPNAPKMRDLPITLPSLAVAKVTIPERMNDLDFSVLISTIKGWKDALVEKPGSDAPEVDPDDGGEDEDD